MEIGEDLFPLFLEVKDADLYAQSLYQRQEKVEEMAEIRRLYAQILEAGDCLSLRDLAVSGDDLIAAGMQPGKELGRVLQDMLRDVVDVPAHNDRDYLLQRYLPS